MLLGILVTHDAHVAQKPCIYIENSFAYGSCAHSWCCHDLVLAAGSKECAAWLLGACQEVVDAVKCFLADELAQHREWQSGPQLTGLQALGADVGDEPLQAVMQGAVGAYLWGGGLWLAVSSE